tara:strand:- start:614 stop:859 length:246 start_codon:yes stop_codon:yes gene_type:complete
MQNSFRPIQELKRTPHTYSSEVEKEPIHQIILDLSKALGKIESIKLYETNEEIERIRKEVLDINEKARDYLLYNYQELRTY